MVESGFGFGSVFRLLAAVAMAGLLGALVLSGCGGDSGTTTNETTLSEKPGMSEPGEGREAEEAEAAKKEAAEGEAKPKAEGSKKEASPPAGGEQLEAGKSVFTTNCGGCHTLADAETTGEVGPDLDQLKPDMATVQHQVENGGGPMPPFKGVLSDEEIEAVSEYVSTVAGKG